jgi:DNA (cytosine-5)-methyltransferase 1
MLTVTDFFCGAGGSSQGMHNIPGLQVATAANHWDLAVQTHQHNFPDVRHDCADISQIDFRRYPRTDLLWASPECTNHSVAKGVKRGADRQPDLFGEVLPEEAAVRSRATMWDVPRYLEAMSLRGRPVLGGVVENVVDARNWALFDAWCMAIRALGYDMRLVYLNSMHARPLAVPVEGREGKNATPVDDPLRTMTTRNETSLAWFEPFLAELRGGGSDHRPASDPLATVCASGNHHGLVHPEAMVVPAGGTWNDEARPVREPFRARTTRETEGLLVPYYGNGTARSTDEPAPTVTTVDRHALVSPELDVEECLFRMLSPAEIGAAMAFGTDYTVLGTKREQVRQYGNAVTPPAAEVLMSALVEAITGEDLQTAA